MLFLNHSQENTAANASVSVWEDLVSIAGKICVQKWTNGKSYRLKNTTFRVPLKRHSTQTLLVVISNNFGFERRMKIRRYWSFGNESLILLYAFSCSSLNTKLASWRVNRLSGSVIVAKFWNKFTTVSNKAPKKYELHLSLKLFPYSK